MLKRPATWALFFCLLPLSLHAFPNEEKASLDLLSSAATSFIRQDDQYLLLSFGSEIFRVDTETWSLSDDQVPALIDNSDSGGDDLTGSISGLAIRGSTLFAAQTDGDLLTIDLDAITEAPTTVSVVDGALGAIVADPDSADDQLYIADETNNTIRVYDISEETSTSAVSLMDSLNAVVSPRALVFVPFTSVADKIFVTTDRGLVFAFNEGGGVATRITLSASSDTLPAAAATPDGDFLLVVDSTDSTVHVIDIASDEEVDMDPLTLGTNPIELTLNDALAGISVMEVSNPSDIYAFVSGSSGISVMDLNIPISGVSDATLDLNSDGDEDAPLSTASSPSLLVSSSTEQAILYAMNGDATLSVISENPFVTIGSTSLAGASFSSGDSFTITFQSDETGAYRVLVGGGLDEDGTEVASGTVTTADADVTTDAIDYDSTLFDEGDNRIFIFVTDADDNVGHDAIDITVDTPPPAVEILSTNFGNQKVYLTLTRLTETDMDHYNVYAGTTAIEVAAAVTPVGTLDQTASGTRIQATVSGLTNGVTYFLGVEGVDAAGNIGVRTLTLPDGTAAFATPQETVGLAGAMGEAGCALNSNSSRSGRDILVLIAGFVLLFAMRLKPRSAVRGVFILILILFSFSAQAKEKTSQWSSLEFKGGIWMPMNTTTRNFLGTVSPMGQMDFGFLYHSRYGVEAGAGYVSAGGNAVGVISGAVSGDTFSFRIIPISNSFTFRADFKEDQLLVPYVKAGPDYVIFRENVGGVVTKGVKYGLHAALGLQILLDGIEDLSETMEEDIGVNDVYFVLEGRYGWINNFSGSGMDLSHVTVSGGFLFEF